MNAMVLSHCHSQTSGPCVYLKSYPPPLSTELSSPDANVINTWCSDGLPTKRSLHQAAVYIHHLFQFLGGAFLLSLAFLAFP